MKLIYHYSDVIMDTIASQITSLTTVYSRVYSGADRIKHQSSASLAYVRGIHRGPVNSPHKWPVTQKLLAFDDVIIENMPSENNKFLWSFLLFSSLVIMVLISSWFHIFPLHVNIHHPPPPPPPPPPPHPHTHAHTLPLPVPSAARRWYLILKHGFVFACQRCKGT